MRIETIETKEEIKEEITSMRNETIETKKEITSMRNETKKEITTIKAENLKLMSRLPDAVISINLTPTIASNATKESSYFQALDMLNIPNPVPTVDVYECPKEENNIVFEWNWKGKIESDSYEPLLQALKNSNRHVVIVDSGQHLPNGNLFREEFWALRKREHENVIAIGKVHGRVDLVELNSPFVEGSYITRSMVRCGIEIKMHSEIDTPYGLNSCIRGSVIQLFGLNFGNINNSPSIILTDLTQIFFCIYLVLDQYMPMKFSVKVQKCLDLSSAVHLAEIKADYLQNDGKPICFNFARRPTPPSSVANDISVDDSNFDNLDGLVS
jgi:hypothetical protein